MVVEIKPNHIDVKYKDMLVRVVYEKFNYSFDVIEGKNDLSPDDKFNLIKIVGGYNLLS